VNAGHTTTVDDTVDLSPLDEPAPAPAEDGRRVEGYRRDGPEPEPRRGPGRLLRVLAGVDETVLDHAPSERPRYTALGGVVLSTATVALPQLSLLVGASKLQPLPHSIVLLAAHVIVGAVVSGGALEDSTLPMSVAPDRVRMTTR